MLKSTRFHTAAGVLPETVGSAEGLEGGAVSSRRTRLEKTIANLDLKYVQAALSDPRVPGMDVSTVDAQTMIVDGHRVTFKMTAEGMSLTVEGYDLRNEQLQGLLDKVQKKLLTLDLLARSLELFDANPQVMGKPVVTLDATGAVEITIVAEMAIDPQRQSQRAGVHAQFSKPVRGDMTTQTTAAKSKKSLATVRG